MIIIDIETLKEECNTVRQFGNHVFTRTADVVNVYQVLTYEKYDPKTLKDLHVTYLITDNTTWDELLDRFHGAPTVPDFKKVLKV